MKLLKQPLITCYATAHAVAGFQKDIQQKEKLEVIENVDDDDDLSTEDS